MFIVVSNRLRNWYTIKFQIGLHADTTNAFRLRVMPLIPRPSIPRDLLGRAVQSLLDICFSPALRGTRLQSSIRQGLGVPDGAIVRPSEGLHRLDVCRFKAGLRTTRLGLIALLVLIIST